MISVVEETVVRWRTTIIFHASLMSILLVGSCLAGSIDNQKSAKKNKEEELLNDYYNKWLKVDVGYLVTPDEKKVFQKLTTNEERDQFIEQFWRRRDPNPKTGINEYKQEHYRRITYANEHFAAGIPGWKSDRGKIYIKFGPPDDIENLAYGSAYGHPYQEGTGQSKKYPTQIWHYRFIQGIGPDVELKFVDKYRGNLYKLETNPNQKDLLLTGPMAGAILSDDFVESRRIDQIVNRQDRLFTKYELLADLSRAPKIKYKDLKSIVNSRIKYDLFPFEVQAYYIKISESQVLVPVTMQIRNKDIAFEDKGFGYSRGVINYYGMVTTLSGRFIKEFEDDIVRDIKTDELETVENKYSRNQIFLLLPSGLYKLGLVVKDVVSGRLGVLDLRLNVPSFKKDKLRGSTLIFARTIQKVDDPKNDMGQFVLGDVKVIPDFDGKFRLQDPFWIYLQIYNMTIDANRLEPKMEVEYIVERDGKPFYRYQDLKGSTFQFMSGDRLVITGKIPLDRFMKGKYTLRILVRDTLSGNAIEKRRDFEITS